MVIARAGKLKLISVPAETVIVATRDLEPDQAQQIRWFHQHCVDSRLSMADAAKLINRSENTLYQVWTGSHGAKKDAICADIGKLMLLVQSQVGTGKVAFVETAMTRDVYELARKAQTFNRIAFLIGEIQRGKTEALNAVVRKMPGEALLLRVPSGGKWSVFLRCVLAPKFGLNPKLPEYTIRREVLKAVNSRTLLVVDEAHQGLERASNPQAGRVLEYLRELQDTTQCGLLICATPTLEHEMEDGKLARMLAQVKERELLTIRLDGNISEEELDTFAAAYGLPPAQGPALEAQMTIARGRSLGAWLNVLRLAQKNAHDGQTALEWGHVLKTSDILRVLRNPQAA